MNHFNIFAIFFLKVLRPRYQLRWHILKLHKLRWVMSHLVYHLVVVNFAQPEPTWLASLSRTAKYESPGVELKILAGMSGREFQKISL